MTYQVIEQNNQTFIECDRDAGVIASEQDALDWVGVCGEQQTDRLMLHAENLNDDFYNLRTGLAGAVLLKFSNYRLRVAAVLTPELVKQQARFEEMVLEANRGSREFRVFYDRENAADWLTAD